MPNPPQDDREQELWTELVRKDINPDAVFEAAQKGGSYGGLHPPHIAEYLKSILKETESWELFWMCAGPNTIGGDHHYRLNWAQVEWNDNHNTWMASDQTFSEAHPYENSFGTYDTVPAGEFHTWLQNHDSDTIFSGVELTDVPRDELPTLASLLFEELPNTIDSRIKIIPDDVGDAYNVTWEVVDWDGDWPGEGTWKPR